MAYGQDKAFSVLLERFFPVWGFAQMLTHSLLEGFKDQYPDLNWNGIWIGSVSRYGLSSMVQWILIPEKAKMAPKKRGGGGDNAISYFGLLGGVLNLLMVP